MQPCRLRFTIRGTMALVAMVAVDLAYLRQPGASLPTSATSAVPKVAVRQERHVHGVSWGMSYDQAREVAARDGRPILLFFNSMNDANSRMYEQVVLSRPGVARRLAGFVTVELYTDHVPIDSLAMGDREKLAEANADLEAETIGESSTPLLAVVDASGRVIDRLGGWNEAPGVIAFLEAAAASHRQSSRTSAGRAVSVAGKGGR